MPKKPTGTACIEAFECLDPSGIQGVNGFCVDGVCCENACAGICQTCEPTSGVCLVLGSTDEPAAPSPADSCPGDGACAGRCDGSSPTTCDFPQSDELAQPASCVCDEGFTDCHLERQECQGDGTSVPAPQSCDGFRCEDESVCKTSCASDGDCILDYICEEGSCVELTGPSCDGHYTVRVPDADDIDCRPFACRDTACIETCASVDDCVPVCNNPEDPSDCVDYVCNAAGECVEPIVGPEVASCNCELVGAAAPRESPGGWLALALVGLGLARRRRC